MGSQGSKERKERRHLPKVPRYREPNSLPLPGVGSPHSFGQRFGRYGHNADGGPSHRPGAIGRAFLWLLGMRHQPSDQQERPTEQHEADVKPNNEEGTVARLSG